MPKYQAAQLELEGEVQKQLVYIRHRRTSS